MGLILWPLICAIYIFLGWAGGLEIDTPPLHTPVVVANHRFAVTTGGGAGRS
jgi:hypothetical protein